MRGRGRPSEDRSYADQPVGDAAISDQPKGESHDSGNDEGRRRRPLPGRLHHRRAPRSAPSTARKGATVFRDPTEEDRVWALFDWDEAGWESFVSDPRSRRSSRKPATSASRRPPCLAGTYRGVRDDDDDIDRTDRPASASSPIKPGRSRSWASPTPTSPTWSSTTSTRGAACSAIPIELFIEDSATDDDAAAAAAAKLVDRGRMSTSLLGGIYSSTRQAIKGPVVDAGQRRCTSTPSSTRARSATR